MGDLKNIQQIILENFKVFKAICHKHHLTYFAIGGTCLGAVRHKGFIPWDDDMDVAMPYEDYKRFLEIAKQDLPANYAILSPYQHRHWKGNFLKLHNIHTTFVAEDYLPYSEAYTGVFLDIMPVFGMPRNVIQQKILAFQANIWVRLNAAFRYDFKELSDFSARCEWISTFPYRYFKKFDYFLSKLEKKCTKYPFNYSDKIMFGWRLVDFFHFNRSAYDQIFEYKDFSSTLEVPFEDTTIAIPIGYDNYLKMDFGDYMKLPPVEQRCPGHQKAIIDLERPYSYYQRRNTK